MTRTRTNIPLHNNDIQGSIAKSLQNRHLGCKKRFNELFRTFFFIALSMFTFGLFPVAMKCAIKAVANYPHHQNYILHID